MQSLRVEANLREGVVPVRDAQVHDHQSEVVREGVGDEEPLAGEILEPNLRLGVRVLENQGQTSVFHLGVNVECADSVLAIEVKSQGLDHM